MKVTKPLIILDLETTGTWVEKDRIIEVGMVKYLPDGSSDTYVKRVNPEIPIPEVVRQLTGISDENVKNAPYFREIANSVLSFIDNSDLAGFNVERFDLPVLERELHESGLSFEWRNRMVYDCQKIYHVHERRDLTAAYRFYCNKDLSQAHSALGDAEATLEILAAQVQKYGQGDEDVKSLSGFDYKQSDDFIDQDRRFRWWNGELYPLFGKYGKKYSIAEIARKDPGYLEWILSKNFSNKAKEVVRRALDER